MKTFKSTWRSKNIAIHSNKDQAIDFVLKNTSDYTLQVLDQMSYDEVQQVIYTLLD